MLKAYKTEIRPSLDQIRKINQSIGVCRWLYNQYLDVNRSLYADYQGGFIDKSEAFISAIDFDKQVNRMKVEPEFEWIALCGSKARKKAICNAESAFKKFFKKMAGFPKFKKKQNEDVKPRKLEIYKTRNRRGGATRSNILRQTIKVQKIYQTLANIRADYICKTASDITGQNPSSVTIEDLNVCGMMKNRHLSKAVSQQNFYRFRKQLKHKCYANDIELRIADRWYPSSRICNRCGQIKKDLKLSDRIYRCDCGYEADRDFNASLNLRDTKAYQTA